MGCPSRLGLAGCSAAKEPLDNLVLSTFSRQDRLRCNGWLIVPLVFQSFPSKPLNKPRVMPAELARKLQAKGIGTISVP